MDLDNINIGLAPDDGTGDKLRDAFSIVNDNFEEIELKTEDIQLILDLGIEDFSYR